ncbi:MAG: nitrate oxidoreductase subunit alpha, partial [Planctomycetota bacterium]
MDNNMIDIKRREFLKLTGKSLILGGITLFTGLPKLLFLEPSEEIENPLEYYPEREWEKVYRDQYRYDGSFTWICSPNCTHECRMRGFLRNGVMIRSEQNYDNHKIRDLYGNQATVHWNPRGCSNGYTFHRRVYGAYRLKYPMIRKGWKQWADDGFPELTPENKKKYKFDSRGTDEFVRIDWEGIYRYIALGMINIAKRYSGEEGRQRLIQQGYPEEMFEHWKGSGVRTFKLRGGMGLLGVIGKYGMYRLANTLALLDAHIRD